MVKYFVSFGLACLLSFLPASESADQMNAVEDRPLPEDRITKPSLWEFERGLLFHDVFRLGVVDGRRHETFLMSVKPSRQSHPIVELDAFKSRLAQRLVLNHIDLTQVSFEEDRIHGDLHLNISRKSSNREMGHGRNAHSMMKSGLQSVLNWNIGGIERVRGVNQRFAIDVTKDHGVKRWVMKFSNLVGDQRLVQAPSSTDHRAVTWEELSAYLPDNAHDMEIVFDHLGGNQWHLDHTKCGWNKGQHQIDGRQLSFENDKLQGVLFVHLMPDGWVPKNNATITLEISFDISLSEPQQNSLVTMNGPWGERSVPVSIEIYDIFRGSYQTSGPDGQWSSALSVITPIETQATVSLRLDHQGDQADKAFFEAAENYRQTISHLVGNQVDQAGPQVVFEPESIDRQWKDALESSITNQGAFDYNQRIIDSPQFLPPSVVKPFPKDEILTLTTREKPVEWQGFSGWETLGPFIQYPGDADVAIGSPLPPVQPEIDGFNDYRRSFGKVVKHTLAWQPATEEGFRQHCSAPDWQQIWVNQGKMSSYKKHPLAKAYRAREQKKRSLLWFAKNTIQVEQAGEYFLSFQVQDHGVIWINDQLMWVSDQQHDPHAPVVLSVELPAGNHEVLLQIQQRNATYFPPADKDRSAFTWWWCVAGHPDVVSSSVTGQTDPSIKTQNSSHSISPATQTPVWGQGLSRYRETSSMPFAWNEEQGINVGWKKTLPHAGQPVLHDDLLVVPVAGQDGPARLVAVDLETGETAWQADVGVQSQVREAPLINQRGIFQRWANGLLTHHNHTGEEVWRIDLGPGPAPLSSTALFDDMIVCAIPVTDQRGRIDKENPQHVYRAYHLDAGDRVWESRQFSGKTPTLAVIAGNGPMNTIVSSHGDAINVIDGQIIAEGLWSFPAHSTRDQVMPIVHGTTLYWATTYGQMAIEFDVGVESTTNTVTPLTFHKRWEQRRSARGGSRGLVVGNYLFVPRIADEYHDHHPVTWTQLDVYDTLTGQHLSKSKPMVRDALNPGNLLGTKDFLIYIEDGTGNGGLGVRYPQPRVLILSAEEQPRVLAQHAWNRGDVLHRTPVISDTGFIVRVNDELISYVQSDEQGALYERQQRAKAVFDRIGPKPRPEPVLVIDPYQVPDADVSSTINTWRSGVAPKHWFLLGPWPQDTPSLLDSVPQSLHEWRDGGFELPEMKGTEGSLLRPLGTDAVKRRSSVRVQTQRGERYVPNYSIDLRTVFGKERNQSAFFISHLKVDQGGVYQLDFKSRGVRMWLNGSYVEHEQLVDLAPGNYQLILDMKLSRLAPVGRPSLSPKWYRRDDPRYALKLWRDRILRNQQALQKIADSLANQPEELVAQQYLKELDG